MEDLWEMKEADKTQQVYGTFEKKMKTGVRKARRLLEIRHRKRKHHQATTDYRNGLSKAQSQDALVLVNTKALWEYLVSFPDVMVGVGKEREEILYMRSFSCSFPDSILGQNGRADSSLWTAQA